MSVTENMFKQVHILNYGKALCGLSGVPRDWPEGHTWVGVTQSYKATCEGCMDAERKMYEEGGG